MASIPRRPRDPLDRLSEGALLWTEDDPRERRLLVPMRTQDQLRGVLVVSPKRTGGLDPGLQEEQFLEPEVFAILLKISRRRD